MLLYQNKDITMKTNLNPKTVEKSKEDLRQAGIHKKIITWSLCSKGLFPGSSMQKPCQSLLLITSLVCYVSKEH